MRLDSAAAGIEDEIELGRDAEVGADGLVGPS